MHYFLPPVRCTLNEECTGKSRCDDVVWPLAVWFMKALIICRPGPVIAGSSPWLAPLLHRPLIAHVLEAVWVAGARDLRVLVAPGDQGLIAWLEAAHVDWRPLNPEDSVGDLLAADSAWIAQGQDVLIAEGLKLPQGMVALSPMPANTIYVLGPQLQLDHNWLWIPAALLPRLSSAEAFQAWVHTPLDWHPQVRLSLSPVTSLQDVLALNQMLLARSPEMAQGPEGGLLPGAKISQSVLGARCWVGEDTHLQGVVVEPGHFIPPGLHLENCLIRQGRIHYANQHFELLYAPIPLVQYMRNRQWRRKKRLWSFWTALSLWLVLVLPYLLLRHRHVATVRTWLGIGATPIALPVYPPTESRFFRWGLHWVPFLRAVMRGQLTLVGSPLLAADQADGLQDLPVYYPGIFAAEAGPIPPLVQVWAAAWDNPDAYRYTPWWTWMWPARPESKVPVRPEKAIKPALRPILTGTSELIH
jgi:hypothetical protein